MAITKLPRSGIADNSINASKIEDGTVAAAEISGTVSAAKLNSTLDISGKTVTLPNTSVNNDQLAGSIANDKLTNSAITVRGTSRALGTSFSLGVDVDWQSKITSDGSTVTTMIAQRGYFVDNSSAAGIVKLPTSASIGDTIAIKDYAGNFGTNNLTIQRNSHNIQGAANDGLIGTNRASVVLVYVDSTKGWLYTDEHNVGSLLKDNFTEATGGTVTTSGDFKIHTFTGDGNFVVSNGGNASGSNTTEYLVVAGGGGGAMGGGGGAGGFRFATPTLNPGTFPAKPLNAPAGLSVTAQTYPITVGGGGGAAPNTCGTDNGASGSNSVFSTITSAGGGGGAGRNKPGCSVAGGSGGGASAEGAGDASGGAGNTPPTSPPQGNNGGGTPSPGNANWGGGGGAMAAGQAGQSPLNAGGIGGAGGGLPTGFGSNGEPCGSFRYYAGGGGGGKNGPSCATGVGGLGGGGNGQLNSSVPNAPNTGTANTGGGGGGGGAVGANGGQGAGGKGIVVLRYKFQN